jgi:hypothetical protein
MYVGFFGSTLEILHSPSLYDLRGSKVLPVMSRQHELWIVTGECRVYVTCSSLQPLSSLICMALWVT